MSEVFGFIFPGMMILWIMFSAPNSFNDLFSEYNHKTLQRLLISTASMTEVILSKIIRCFIICLVSQFLLIVITKLLFGMKWGNPLLLIVVITCLTISITGLVAVLFGLASSKQKADIIVPVFVMFMAFVGGGMIPYGELPPFIQKIGTWTIMRQGVVAIQATNQGQPLYEIMKPCIILTIVGIILCSIGFLLLKRRFEKGEVQ